MEKIIIIVTGAGGSASIGFCRSLRDSKADYEIVGLDSDKYHICLAETDFKHLVPRADDPDYVPIVNYIARKYDAHFLHSQPDPELAVLSENREKLIVKTNFPKKEVVRNCLDKFKSYKLWKEAGIQVPKTMLVGKHDCLKEAFKELGPKIWIRNIKGSAGKGALPTTDYDEAVAWISFCKGWGEFTAAEYLSENTVTWQSLWNKGELVAAQTRLRKYWEFSNRSPSGVTGLTGTSVTISDKNIDEIALKCIYAVDKEPNGIFSVDLTYDKDGIPNPTEINIGRFFTTHHFFTRAGLNFPDIYVKTSLDIDVKLPKNKFNPLEENQVWIRGLDSIPVLTKLSEIEDYYNGLQKLRGEAIY